MECKCGSETNSSTHIVKTLTTAIEWEPTTERADLPIRVHQDICKGCGRTEWYTEKKFDK